MKLDYLLKNSLPNLVRIFLHNLKPNLFKIYLVLDPFIKF